MVKAAIIVSLSWVAVAFADTDHLMLLQSRATLTETDLDTDANTDGGILTNVESGRVSSAIFYKRDTDLMGEQCEGKDVPYVESGGVMFTWASPCSGGCSMPVEKCGWGICSDAQWANLPEAQMKQEQPCSAQVFDPKWNHCDASNKLVQRNDNGYNELVFCKGAAGDAAPAPAPDAPAAEVCDGMEVPYTPNNGVMFTWASPCSGGCSVAKGKCGWGICSNDQWKDLPRDQMKKDVPCSAKIFDPVHNHCDASNNLVQHPNNGYDELVFCKTMQALHGLDEQEREQEIDDEEQDVYECADWCDSKKHSGKPWEKKCKWNACNECGPCRVPATPSPTPAPAPPAKPVCGGLEVPFTENNGVMFTWASPCSGGCSMPVAKCGWGICSDAQWASLPESQMKIDQPCSANIFDPKWNHCDASNRLVQKNDGGYNELVFCKDAGGAAPAPAPVGGDVNAPESCEGKNVPFTPNNGVKFTWASPCSGGCSTPVPKCGWGFCSDSQWQSLPEAQMKADQPCSSDVFDPKWNHCDPGNKLVQKNDNGYNELVFCKDA